MKTALCFVFVLGTVYGESDSASGKPEEVRATVSEALKREFRYEPQLASTAPPSEGGVIVLPRFDVIDSSIKGIEQAVNGARQKVENEKFSWKKGGTFFKRGPVSVMFKYDPASNSVYLLKVSW